ncbi:MAG: C/D box methylation guide ribonucleoprotein complex aNOP56 subunit [Candidatus Lokiarchaeota archaeon]|nr:C/D box methylation guide ribonucleoprotein complex aNOP56 subunit [Candidatus Lokiarchaeota archaeon]MBD3202231.1 C/D box methylation guide ribonucleoprotein complex aNOP56 subunit [Candidatus Lokiarchaeota archaeon]
MIAHIIDTLIGIFALDSSGNLLNYRDFNGDKERLVDFFQKVEEETLVEEYEEFIKELEQSGFNEFIFDNKDLESLSASKLNIKTSFERKSLEFRNFRLNLESELRNIGIEMSINEILEKFKAISEILVKKKVKEVGEKKDKIIIQISETLETLKKTISLFSSRIREWYGLHFPELTDTIIEDNITLSKIISYIGDKNDFSEEKLVEKIGLSENYARKITKMAQKSMGAPMELEMVQNFADKILLLDNYRAELEQNLEDLMEQTAPNIKAIVGALIGSKLIAQAGSLRKLAFMPASRIQLLGAETALYRFLKTGEKLPKHGLIFQWQQIRGNPPWIRGNISRLIAGKLGLAAKVDFFSGDFIGDNYANEIEEKIKQIKQRYPEPPKKEKRNKNRRK